MGFQALSGDNVRGGR